MVNLLAILGALLVLEGIPYFAFPGKTKDWALSMQQIPSRHLRIMGLLSMAAGLVILYASRFL